MAEFTLQEWTRIHNRFDNEASSNFSLPIKENNSVVIGTFNIRELGKLGNRPDQAWGLLKKICLSFDLLAIQEVADDLSGLIHLKSLLTADYGLVVSDVTGTFPGDSGNSERMAFLFNWNRIRRTELASDITYDRSKVVETLFENRDLFNIAWEEYLIELGKYEEKCRIAEIEGKRKPSKPKPELPVFLTFIRQPHCASFEIVPKPGNQPIGFLAVNAHLLFGERAFERKAEFMALIEWLYLRAKQAENMYHKNMILLGDCNLEFKDFNIQRTEIDDYLKSLNETRLTSKKAAKANFPLLSEHPNNGFLATSARQKDTYDQIGIFTHNQELPDYTANATAGTMGKDGYDYGVFKFTDLIAKELFNSDYNALNKTNQDYIINRSQWDISDHLPAWIRIPIP